MLVSVIIPTYNGAHKLPDIIKAIQEQSYQPYEVLFVVDGSSDNTMEVLGRIQKTITNLKIIYQKNTGRASVRNKGAKEARGELLVFFDDDMLPVPSCLEKHVLHHQNHKNSILTGAQIDLGGVDRSDLQQFKSKLSYKWSSVLKESVNVPLTKERIFITAANFSVYKNILLSLGGFDESLTDAEDFDLAVRSYKAGIPLYFNFNAFAWHNDAITCASYIRRQRQYTKAHKILIKSKPWFAEENFFIPLQKPSGLRKKIFQLFCSRIWIQAVDNGKFKILPQAVRYKLYDLIITANGVYFPEKVKI